MLHTLMAQMVQWSVDLVAFMGYPGIVLLMALESSVFPWPSELVMPQAGYLAASGKMNIWIAVLMATIGSILGALINYGLAYWLGRPFLMKYGKYVLCPPHKFAKMETFFLRHGEVGTFTGRLVLGVRHFISFPAGLARMNLARFSLYTGVGAGLWATVLAWIEAQAARTPERVAVVDAVREVRYGALIAFTGGLCIVTSAMLSSILQVTVMVRSSMRSFVTQWISVLAPAKAA